MTSLLNGDFDARGLQVSGGTQRLLVSGPFTVTVRDRPAAQHPAPAAQPPPSGTPSGGLYPSLYQQPQNAGASGSASGSATEINSHLFAAVGGVSWEVLPRSQTLKVGVRATLAPEGARRRCAALQACRSAGCRSASARRSA